MPSASQINPMFKSIIVILLQINSHIPQTCVFCACFHPIKNVYLVSKTNKITCYASQVPKLFLIIMFLITVSINSYLIN
jgi:hypothetical protein